MCGTVGLEGGGVGGMSPVIRTRASTPAASSRSAAMGVSLKRSCDDGRGLAWCNGGGVRAWPISLGSAAGTGAGGGEVGVVFISGC